MPLENGQPGIDIEHIAEGRGLEAIMRNTVNPLEARKLQASRDIATAATLCFSGKEALYKALFPTVGRFFGFSSAALDAPPLNNQLSLRLTETLHSSLASGMEFDIFYRVKGDHVMTWLVYQPSSVQRSS